MITKAARSSMRNDGPIIPAVAETVNLLKHSEQMRQLLYQTREHLGARISKSHTKA